MIADAPKLEHQTISINTPDFKANVQHNFHSKYKYDQSYQNRVHTEYAPKENLHGNSKFVFGSLVSKSLKSTFYGEVF